jgi:hypothetical protein
LVKWNLVPTFQSGSRRRCWHTFCLPFQLKEVFKVAERENNFQNEICTLTEKLKLNRIRILMICQGKGIDILLCLLNTAFKIELNFLHRKNKNYKQHHKTLTIKQTTLIYWNKYERPVVNQSKQRQNIHLFFSFLEVFK